MRTDEPTIAAEIDNLNRTLLELAQAGDWTPLAKAMRHRDELLGEVAPNERATVFKAAVRSNDLVLELVRSGRQAVRSECLALRRRRDGAGQYELHR